MNKTSIAKVVLAYSGGLDTSVIVKWLQETYGCEVITFTADIGQGNEIEPAREKAQDLGVRQIFIEDLKEEFVRDFVFPMFRANTIYESEYMLGTSIARPLISKRLVEIATETGADAISHGATGKGNDQVRFELGAYALNSDIKIIAPWREWNLDSRTNLLSFCERHGIKIDSVGSNKFPYSTDANLLHISYEGGDLEDPWCEPRKEMWQWTRDIEDTPDEPEVLTLTFSHGDVIEINNERKTPAQILKELNLIAGIHGIGRSDIVENRFVGMKSRGCYETPGGSVILRARRAIESITLDREVLHFKDEIMPKYAKLIYNGFWWSPERMIIQEAVDKSQEFVNGFVRLKLFKGNITVLGRKSETSLYDENIASFDGNVGFEQKDAEGFIKINALRLRLADQLGRKL